LVLLSMDARMDMEKEESEKRKFLYDFAKSIYSEELTRFKALEDKAARYFGFLSILIGTLTLFIRLSEHKLISDLEGPLSWLYLAATVLTYATIINSGRLLFEVLKPRLLALIDLSSELKDYYSNQPLNKIYTEIVDDLMEATKEARIINNEKCTHINNAHREIGASLVFFTILITIHFLL